MTSYLTRLKAVERKLTPEAPEARLLVVYVDHDDDEAARRAKVNAAAAARGIDPNAVPLRVLIVRWTRPATEATP